MPKHAMVTTHLNICPYLGKIANRKFEKAVVNFDLFKVFMTEFLGLPLL
jgi:hypothetical protein